MPKSIHVDFRGCRRTFSKEPNTLYYCIEVHIANGWGLLCGPTGGVLKFDNEKMRDDEIERLSRVRDDRQITLKPKPVLDLIKTAASVIL